MSNTVSAYEAKVEMEKISRNTEKIATLINEVSQLTVTINNYGYNYYYSDD